VLVAVTTSLLLSFNDYSNRNDYSYSGSSYYYDILMYGQQQQQQQAQTSADGQGRITTETTRVTQSLLRKPTSTDVDEASIPTTPPRCWIKVVGRCKEFPALGNSDEWFDDYKNGGPPATTIELCQHRQRSWQISCQLDLTDVVQMSFGPRPESTSTTSTTSSSSSNTHDKSDNGGTAPSGRESYNHKQDNQVLTAIRGTNVLGGDAVSDVDKGTRKSFKNDPVVANKISNLSIEKIVVEEEQSVIGPISMEPFHLDEKTTGLSAYEIYGMRTRAPRTKTLPDRYLTLWLHQVHRWFGTEDVRLDNVRQFVEEAKNAGYTSIMTDLPWEWTEREAMGSIDVQSFNKDWMKLACEAGLKLQVVISARDMPPWMKAKEQADGDVYTAKRSPCVKSIGIDDSASVLSMAHPYVWERGLNYTIEATKALLVEYGGECVIGVSPTWNNEFETRYNQDSLGAHDYSPSMIDRYKEWQVSKGLTSTVESAVEPPVIPCEPVCQPYPSSNRDVWNWLGFREEFLAQKYMDLCQSVREASGTSTVDVADGNAGKEDNNEDHMDGKLINCFLHFGENLATVSDHLNSNPFFKLARSPHVTELVMDSNVALSGAPASPSSIGLIVSLAKVYTDKIVHYEAATERVVECDDNGKFIPAKSPKESKSLDSLDRGAPLLLRTSVILALEQGIGSFGVTNLCQPNMTASFTPPNDSRNDGNSIERDDSSTSSTGLASIQGTAKFEPTAVLFVPYRAFYAFNGFVSGIQCNSKPMKCWHSSLSDPSFLFGLPKLHKNRIVPGTCPVDVLQAQVVKAWDDLRLHEGPCPLRDDHVSVASDPTNAVDSETEHQVTSSQWQHPSRPVLRPGRTALSSRMAFVPRLGSCLGRTTIDPHGCVLRIPWLQTNQGRGRGRPPLFNDHDVADVLLLRIWEVGCSNL